MRQETPMNFLSNERMSKQGNTMWMTNLLKLFIIGLVVAPTLAASISNEALNNDKVQASSRRLLQTAVLPQARSPKVAFRPGCSLGPVCPPGATITCENDEETGETGGCVCGLVHNCHPERKNCTYYYNGVAGGACGF